MFRPLPFAIALTFLIYGCKNEQPTDPGEISRLDAVAMDDIYLDYRLHAEEGDDNLNLVLQFREGDAEGRTLFIGDAGAVTLDGENMPADSTERNGAYYEIQKPIDAFRGEHQIMLEGPDSRRLEENFRFSPMAIETAFPDTLSRLQDLVIPLSGMEKVEYVRVLMMDTSFASEGINRLDTVRDGRLVIRRGDLAQLHCGDIHLELHRETERPTSNDTPGGGKFSLTYVLKRDFILSD